MSIEQFVHGSQDPVFADTFDAKRNFTGSAEFSFPANRCVLGFGHDIFPHPR